MKPPCVTRLVGLALAAATLLSGFVLIAAGPPPLPFSTGSIDPSVPVNGVPLGTTQQLAASALQLNALGGLNSAIPVNGVALGVTQQQAASALQLNAAGFMSAPVQSATGNFGASYTSGSTSVYVPEIGLVGQSPDQFTGADAVLMGGLTGMDGAVASSSLNVSGHPYGAFNAGCVLCVLDTADGLQGGGGRAAISGVDYRAGASAVTATGGYDQVGFYEFTDNSIARGVLPVASFSATGLTLATAMTPAQQNALRPGMYIVTNIVDPTISGTVTTGLLAPTRYYSGFISAWTPTTITVSGWAVASSGKSTAGQVPQVANLDAAYSNYAFPVVFIGEPTKSFGRNLFMTYDGSRSTGSPTRSVIHQMEGEEMDMFVSNETRLASVQLHGITITPLMSGTNPNVLTNDSYDIQLAGNIPDHLLINEAPTNNVIRANSMLVRGNGGVSAVAGNTAEMFEHSAFTGGANNMRLTGWLANDSGAAGYTGTSLHLGLLVDGTQGTVGVPQAQLVFDPPAAGGTGTVGMFGYSGTGVLIHGNGAAEVQGSLAVDGVITAPLTTVLGSPATAVGSQALADERTTYLDSNRMRMLTYTSRDTAGGGWTSGSVHLGLTVDGAQDTTGGSVEGQIVFNAQGGTGGLSLCGYGVNCGLSVAGNGAATMPLGLTAGTGLIVGPTGGAKFPSGLNVSPGGYLTSTGSGLAPLTSQGVQLGWNCSGSGGELCLQAAGDAGSSKGFKFYQDQADNIKTNALVTMQWDGSGNLASLGSISSGGTVATGPGVSLILRTPGNATGGTLNSDAAGDVYVGTQVSGGSLVSSLPIVAQNGLGVTGSATISGSLTAGSNIQTGGGASLILRTPGNGVGGTLNSDAGGDIYLGTQVGGGKVVSTVPIVESNALTPASSSAACVAGQHAWDASYEYRCVATNTWKRAALSAF